MEIFVLNQISELKIEKLHDERDAILSVSEQLQRKGHLG